MYDFLKGFHNLLRWVVVVGGVAAVVLLIRGVVTQAAWTARERAVTSAFTYSLHTQLLVGIVLYGVTPLMRLGMSAPLTDRLLLIEHASTMILAVVAAQVGLSTARRASTDRARYLRATIGTVVAALFIAWATPWGRSLLPWV